MRLEKETFGPVLRAARERRGITLKQIAAETKLGTELWADLENNNLSRWPRQIYARSYVRDYALRIGMDADEIVNEFCRLFPEWGDRRAERLIRGQAAIINHDLLWQDLPAKEQRRASDRAAQTRPSLFTRHRTRIIAAAIDIVAVFAISYGALLLRAPFWPSLGITALSYSAAATLFSTNGFGFIASEWLIRVISAMPAARRRLVSSRAS
jgi:transcriptional regulator with XRE-family HTH domain